ncbi:MAG: transposase [Leptolyngbya sp. SIO1E4]|nr:transposase [Leptolyngbya sp. SIO1E4]
MVRTAIEQQALKPSELTKVNVDTTVPEKAVAFPTDARLYDKARRALVRTARQHRLRLRQSIVAADAVHGNPYDGATLKGALHQTQQLTGHCPQKAIVDQGFRGKSHHPEDAEVVVAGTRKRTRSRKRLLQRRSAIEPVIGHVKQDHALKRNFLRGQQGDRMNAFLAGCGFNLRKLFRFFLTAPAKQTQAIA